MVPKGRKRERDIYIYVYNDRVKENFSQRKRERNKRNERNKERGPRGLCVFTAMFSLRRITTTSRREGRIPREREREREKRDNKERRKRREGGVKGETSRRQSWSSCSYVLHTLAERGERGLYMLLHCGAQCSIISPSIPSALIDERVRRAGARESGRGGSTTGEKKKRRKRRRGCR